MRRGCIRPLLVKATRGHFLDAVGHRSHASENPSKDLHSKGIARLRQTSQMRPSQTGSYTLTVERETQNHPHDFQKSRFSITRLRYAFKSHSTTLGARSRPVPVQTKAAAA